MKFAQYILAIFTFSTNCFSNESVTYKEGMHVPLVFIIDNMREDTLPLTFLEANTYTLNLAIKSQSSAIIVNRSVLYAFVHRRQNWDDPNHPENKELKDTTFSRDDWELFRPVNQKYFNDDNQFYILIPKDKKNYLLKYLISKPLIA